MMNIEYKTAQGFTFVEVMIALAIGITLTFMTLTIFSNNKRAYDTNNRIIEMNENIRFALSSMIEDLENAGFYGGATTLSDANLFSNVECDYGVAGDADYISTSTETLFPVWGKSATKLVNCITASDITKKTDYISIRGVRGKIVADNRLKKKYIYIKAGNTEGEFRHQASLTTVSNATNMNWKYFSNLYFICKNRLLRKSLYYDGGPKWKLEVLSGADLWDENSSKNIKAKQEEPRTATCADAPDNYEAGIERMTFLYGVDSDQDGVADYYEQGDNIVNSDLHKIVEVKVYLLARSEMDLAFKDKKVISGGGGYSMGATTYKPDITDNGIPGDSIDIGNKEALYYHRKLYKNTFFIRNNWYQIQNDPSNL